MSIWSRIGEALRRLASGETLADLIERLRTPPEKSVAFTISVIALGAKMAKADGMVTRDEVAAFREVFSIPEGEEQNAARVFNLARQDVAGFEEYASKIARMFGPGSVVLLDLLEGLFHIAVADSALHPQEEAFLARVAELFGMEARTFRGIRSRYVKDARPDPYDVLGMPPDAPLADIRAAWRALVRDTHPDRLMARGLPSEAIKLAEKRLIAVNDAWADIQADRAA